MILAPRSLSPKRTAPVMFYVTEDEKSLIEATAHAIPCTISSLMRSVFLDFMSKGGSIVECSKCDEPSANGNGDWSLIIRDGDIKGVLCTFCANKAGAIK